MVKAGDKDTPERAPRAAFPARLEPENYDYLYQIACEYGMSMNAVLNGILNGRRAGRVATHNSARKPIKGENNG